MILGIGIDSVEVERFMHWHTYSHATLSRLFSDEEIHYCLSIKNKSAERFAVRFAAREAFFKAFTAMRPTHSVPFLTLCKAVSVAKQMAHPILYVDWERIINNKTINPNQPIVHLSLTHTKTAATAYIIIEKRLQ